MPGTDDRRNDPRERVPESASFDTARVGGPRFRPPVVVAGFLVLLIAIVAVGVGGQSSPSATPGRPLAAVASPSVAPRATMTQLAHPPARGPRASAIPAAPVMTSGPGAIQLVAQRSAAGMFVHGDVFVPRVTWVYVSLADDAGNIAGWASVSVPGAAGPGKDTGPTLRFDVELALSADFRGRLWISANAYDDAGTLIGGTRLEAASTLRPRLQFEP